MDALHMLLAHAEAQAAKQLPDHEDWVQQVEALEFLIANQAHGDAHRGAELLEKVMSNLPPDISPEPVRDVEGWANLGGLNVSKRRYYGCHLLQHREESARVWMREPERIAERYGTSKRVIAMAGYAMHNQWVMLPCKNLHGGDYVINPPVVPYIEAERETWVEMFVKYHFVGAYVSAMYLHGGAVVIDGKPIPRTYVYTIANSPEKVVPELVKVFETPQYKYRAFRTALFLATQIDNGARDPVPGYEKIDPALKRKLEPTAPAAAPKFQTEAEN